MSYRKGILGIIGLLALSLSHGLHAEEPEPGRMHPLYARAHTLIEAGIWQEAVFHLEQYLATVEDATPAAHLEAAHLLFQMGLDRRAADHAAQFLNHQPGDPEARRLLIRIRSRLALEMDRSNADQVLHFARLARTLGNTDRASSNYALALALSDDADILLEWARTMRWGGRLPRALSLYRDYLARRPNDQEAQQELGRLLNELGRHADAASVLNEAFAQTPHDPALALDLARALHWSGQMEQAAETLDSLRERGRANVDALLVLAEIKHALGQYPKAHRIYSELMTYSPPPAEAQFWVNQYERERLLQIASLRDQLETDPGDIETRKQLIHLYMERGRFADARQNIEWLLPLVNRDPELLTWQHQIRRRELDQVAERLNALRDMRAGQPNGLSRLLSWWTRYHDLDFISQWAQARHLRQVGRHTEARLIYRRLLEHNPEHPAIKAALSRNNHPNTSPGI